MKPGFLHFSGKAGFPPSAARDGFEYARMLRCDGDRRPWRAAAKLAAGPYARPELR
ncbi:MAG: hypothetical protein HY874_12750 [Chloroflexi bacterium]|nr:hypothetical protein [Chloroflexota bacterium]